MIIAIVLALIASFLAGFYFRVLWDKVKSLEAKIATRIKATEPKPEPDSTFLDPDDIIQQARFEQAEIQRKLNPDDES